MIQKVFLDTNILIDIIHNREPFVNEALKILTSKEEYNYELYVSSLSIANLAYLLDKLKRKPHPVIAKVLYWAKTISLTQEIIHETTMSKFEDFEDGLQYFSAISANVDVIITRDTKDYKHSMLPIMIPAEFLEFLQQ